MAEALTSVARIKGWISETVANGHEGELVNMVVAKVSSELKTTWIERLPMFPILMSNDYAKSVHRCLLEKKRRESKWQVFLAFRGPDTRFGFAAYLYISLVTAGIRVFNDNDPYLIGKDVAHEIRNAIDHCEISIPIISENYASSPWCLNELAQMVESKRIKGQEILPIFYKVSTSHVRNLSHFFGECMLRHKKLVDTNTYERWEQALREVGSSKGWATEKIANGHEGLLVKRVVKEVSRLLNNPRTRDPPIPIPKHISRM
ncbi:toll/interleukin-1 receptor-like protein [Eucalyptus grandis]|uniref:toll/interleukin-1 receptor-like protein n=1 Tax=Eucalyptus grandis TaxID=71139 RepID=UPI00192EF021|nr:toll/interleukin-1 receptor-like protein [Eucalyptus grandis]